MSPPTLSVQGRIGVTNNQLGVHPNGKLVRMGFQRPERDDRNLFDQTAFPDSDSGRLLRGLMIEFLAKQEHRCGWARKSACDETSLSAHPNETVAAHQWGVAILIMTLTRQAQFQEEIPHFDTLKALEMALMHDVAEVSTGDITPVDGISPEEKHKLESEAMDMIMGCFPESISQSLRKIYTTYEHRECIESKFVKDCDKLDFIIQAFILERQGFSGFSEFYPNSINHGFTTTIAAELAKTLTKTRNELEARDMLYRRNC